MKLFIIVSLLSSPNLLDAGIFGRSAAKKEYEQIVSEISRVKSAITFDQWRPRMKRVDTYAQKYGAPGARGRWTDQLEFFTGIFFNKGGLNNDQKSMLQLDINSLNSAILELQKSITAPRENRYALELYKALFEKLKNATKSFLYDAKKESLDAVGGSVKDLVVRIQNPQSNWYTVKKLLRENSSGPLAQSYQKVLSDVEKYVELMGFPDEMDAKRLNQLKQLIPANIQLLKNKQPASEADRRTQELYEPLMNALEEAFKKQG